jgi:transglutaminase-like putative cysteine protease
VAAAGQDLAAYFTLAADLPDKELQRLKVKLSGLPEDYLVEDFNQSVAREGDSFIVEIRRLKPNAEMSGPPPEEWPAYLGEDGFIQFEDPLLQDTLRGIVGEEKDPWIILRKLSTWIDQNIEKTPTFAFPNSLDTLRVRRGDCGELSALMVGFLRSLGIPSYVNIGLVYQEGRFFYHIWPSLYIGQWFDTDPALGQLVADARRIKLWRGFSGQFEIFRILGKLKLEVLDYD